MLIYSLVVALVLFIAVDYLTRPPTGIPTQAPPKVTAEPDEPVRSASTEQAQRNQQFERATEEIDDLETDALFEEHREKVSDEAIKREVMGHLKASSYVCTRRNRLVQLQEALRMSEDETVDELMDRYCGTRIKEVEVEIQVWNASGNRAKVLVLEGSNPGSYWTFTHNLRRGS